MEELDQTQPAQAVVGHYRNKAADGRNQRTGSNCRIDLDLFEKQWNTRTNRTGDQHCQKQGNTDARGYRIGKGEGLSFDCKNIESDQYTGHQSQQTTVA